MASLSYQEIVQRLDTLDAGEIRMLLLEVESRARKQHKRHLAEFFTEGPLKPDGEDWVKKQRQEWTAS